MSDFIQNETEEILYSTTYYSSRAIYFYKNQSTSFFNSTGNSGTMGTRLVITSQRIVYEVAKFVKIFNSKRAESLGIYGFELKREEITNAFLRKAVLPVSQEYVFETKSIVFGIPVGYFWDNKIKNAVEKFLGKNLDEN
ncbi:MAG: hypothetical protein WCK98_01940 [bacterium]